MRVVPNYQWPLIDTSLHSIFMSFTCSMQSTFARVVSLLLIGSLTAAHIVDASPLDRC